VILRILGAILKVVIDNDLFQSIMGDVPLLIYDLTQVTVYPQSGNAPLGISPIRKYTFKTSNDANPQHNQGPVFLATSRWLFTSRFAIFIKFTRKAEVNPFCSLAYLGMVHQDDSFSDKQSYRTTNPHDYCAQKQTRLKAPTIMADYRDIWSPAKVFSPSAAKHQTLLAKDWSYIDQWLSARYHPKPVPKFERNPDTLKALLALAAANEAADEERALEKRVKEKALAELKSRDLAAAAELRNEEPVLIALEENLTPEGTRALNSVALLSVALGSISTSSQKYRSLHHPLPGSLS
jgi:hypothetical protein